jgi:plasmid replication initiation protein
VTGTQVDLFLDQIIDAPIKDDRALMEHPFFSLQKRPRMEPFIYDNGAGVRVEVNPGAHGMATIWDKDLLIYIASILNDRIERGDVTERTIRFPAYDFLKVTGRGTGPRAYKLFDAMLDRLQSTSIRTTIEAGGDKDRRFFSWIESAKIIERPNKNGKKVMVGVEVTLNDWMFRSIVQDRRILSINRNYFSLTMGLERRLYELARKHVGNQPEWFIGIRKLADKCGSIQASRKFKADLKRIIERGSIPDYCMELIDAADAKTPFKTNDGKPLVRFSPLSSVIIDDTPEPAPKPKQPSGPPLITTETYEAAREQFPGYDIYFLEKRWQEWTMARGTILKKPDRAFLAWCRTYTTNNPL